MQRNGRLLQSSARCWTSNPAPVHSPPPLGKRSNMAAAASSATKAPAKAGAGGNAPAEGAGSIVLGGKLKEKRGGDAECFDKDYDFAENAGNHFYARALNATVHPMVKTLFGMPTESILIR